jgi:SNW domain-containing protein 1
MASFISALPLPRHTAIDEDDDEDFFAMQAARGGAPAAARKKVPPYGSRSGFIPRSNEDFGEGGAFPEVHVAQYPLNMGR